MRTVALVTPLHEEYGPTRRDVLETREGPAARRAGANNVSRRLRGVYAAYRYAEMPLYAALKRIEVNAMFANSH